MGLLACLVLLLLVHLNLLSWRISLVFLNYSVNLMHELGPVVSKCDLFPDDEYEFQVIFCEVEVTT